MNAVEQRLETVFNDIAATRMAGLPICNTELHVKAVGFRAWQGLRVGVLVTPWTINLVLLPGEGAALKGLGPDEKQTWEFPSGRYEFMGLNEAALGECQMCPLISPVAGIASQAEAEAIAAQVMTALFAADKPDDVRDEERRQQFEAARLSGEPVAAQEVSRRDFLRGAFLGM